MKEEPISLEELTNDLNERVKGAVVEALDNQDALLTLHFSTGLSLVIEYNAIALLELDGKSTKKR